MGASARLSSTQAHHTDVNVFAENTKYGDKLGTITNYEISGRTFIVQSVFQKDSTETFGTILLKLMKEEL